MCGFLGIIWTENPNLSEAKFQELLKLQKHRGPDVSNFKFYSHCYLGHNRLSIVDVKNSSQPMSTWDSRYTIVFNGEIYNYKELTQILTERDIKFDANSDTSVLLNGYVALGKEFLSLINGMYSFAVYDRVNQTVDLVRDRIGKKPLFYSLTDFGLIFSSNIRSIYCSGLRKFKINPEAIFFYLKYGFIPEDYCIFEEVYKVPSASIIRYDRGEITKQLYWNLPTDRSLGKYIKSRRDLKNLITSSVELRVEQADVEVSTFLSGGVDSSGISCMAQKVYGRRLKSYHLIPDSMEYNESFWAKKVASSVGLDLKIKELSDSRLTELKKIVKYMDEPFGDSSALPTFQVSKLASKDVKVVLSGEGGDEMFLGYDWQRRFIQTYLPRSICNFLCLRITKPIAITNTRWPRLKILLNLCLLTHAAAYEFLYAGGKTELLNSVLSISLRKKLKKTNKDLVSKLFNTSAGNNFQKMLNVDIKHYLGGDLLVKVDTMSMANSLEVRSPLLDYRIIEYSAKVPAFLKIIFSRKYEIKNIFKDFCPAEILNRKEKRGFSINKNNRLDNNLINFIFLYLQANKDKFLPLFDMLAVEKLLNKNHRSTHENDLVWNILIFALWVDGLSEE